MRRERQRFEEDAGIVLVSLGAGRDGRAQRSRGAASERDHRFSAAHRSVAKQIGPFLCPRGNDANETLRYFFV